MSTILRERQTTPSEHRISARHVFRVRDDLLLRYRMALSRHGDPEPQRDRVADGYDVRTCARCGEEDALFQLDPEGSWAYCTACGRAA
jgi:hypothetical protein